MYNAETGYCLSGIKKAVGFDSPTALNWKTEAINPWQTSPPIIKKEALPGLIIFHLSTFNPFCNNISLLYEPFEDVKRIFQSKIISLTFIPNVFRMAFMKRERKIAVKIIKWWWRSPKREVCPLG